MVVPAARRIARLGDLTILSAITLFGSTSVLAAQSIHAPARLALLEAPAYLAASPAPALESSSSSLPDEPLAQPDPAAQDDQHPKGPQTPPGAPFGRAGQVQRPPRPATSTDITIAPGVIAPRQSAGDKLLGSVYDAISPFTLFGELISASYSQLTDGSPNYSENGSTGKQFGQRLGAAVARGTSQNLFSEGVLATVLHEDPRYYQMGDGHRFFSRLVYAGTRPLVSRTDSGHVTPNLSLLGGYLGAAELTPVYYPALNSTQTEVMKTWGASIGGAALGYVVTEFLPDVLTGLHLQRFQHR